MTTSQTTTDAPRLDHARTEIAPPLGDGRRVPPVLSIVVPCYDEELIVRESARRLRAQLTAMIESALVRPSSFIYFVDDGSSDATWAIIAELHGQDPAAIKGLKLSRNTGHQRALLAGLLSVKDRADCVVSIDADLQHDEAAIPRFVEKYAEGAEVVFGVRNDRRADSAVKRGTASFFYYLMRAMGVSLVGHHADYRLLSRKALDALAEYREVNLFLRGIVVDAGFKSEVVRFDVRGRRAGKSKYSLRKMISFALDGITSFSVVPLRVVTFTGFAIFVFSFLMSLYALLGVFRGNVVPGWASTVIPIYFIGGIQVMLMGLIGEYVGKIYNEVKARPRFIKDAELF